jgi:hypothetical protein
MWVTGDRSGALLLIMVGSRDYLVPLDFEGRRYVEIPNGEVSWSRSDWGWRMETKSNDYGHVREVKIGFGQLPPHGAASVKVERLTALGEAFVELQNPVVHVDQGQVAVRGAIPSGYFLQYDGGDFAMLFDENWQEKGKLLVERINATMPCRSVNVSITVAQPGPWPWLEMQFLTAGTPIPVGMPAERTEDRK